MRTSPKIVVRFVQSGSSTPFLASAAAVLASSALLDLPLQLADLLLRLSELLFEEPEPLLSRRFRRGPPGGADEARREHNDEHE